MNQHIHCIVSDCHYYESGNKCVANEILVATDQFGASQPEQVDAQMAMKLTPETAGNCMETCCKSYIPKNSNFTSSDSVKKMQ
ncbi:MAG: DUF1540 domain-containing protein [Clostridia bacterium]|jgi:hypothetical protein|nr:DUF1540 domain-containing protein [Clostridia bacterium]